MRKKLLSCALTFGILSPLAPSRADDAPRGIPCGPPQLAEKAKAPARTIEVCFVLDTTGSMGGLIDGAKKKIWTIANSIIAQDSTAKVRFALVPYRDRGDEYVTKIFELTDDLDKVFADLQSFTANGGGDEPESVNQGLDDAVNKVSWSAGDAATKFIFLVGDCPPHMDYGDDVKYPQTCEAAVKKNIIVNTIECGGNTQTRDIWQEIAHRSEGSFVALEQSGGMVVVETPMDKEIAELSGKIGALAVPYGSPQQQASVATKNSTAAAAAPAAVTAERAAYNAKSNRAIQGVGDLVTDVREGKADVATLKDEDLPPDMKKMSVEERKAHLKKQAEERDQLTGKVNELAKQRDAYIAEQNRKLVGKGDAFDQKVSEIVAAQMKRKP